MENIALMSIGKANQTISSREIAELTGKRHADVMEAIRNMEQAWINVGQRNFSLMFSIMPLPNGGQRKDPYYELTKKECLYVATKFNDEARARLIIRWEELETQHRLPQSFSEALMLAARQAEEIEQKNIQLQEQKPKVLFADSVAASKSSILVGELAKLIKQNGVDMGANRLFDYLRENGFLIKRKGSEYNMPTQKAMELGLFEIKERTIDNPDGTIRLTKTSKVTGKGQVFFVNHFLRLFKPEKDI